MIDKQVVGKMGLRGTPGLNVGVVDKGVSGRGGGGGRGRGGGGGGGGRGGAQKGGGRNAGSVGGAPNGRPLAAGGVQKNQRGFGQGRRGGRTRGHQGPPGTEI